MVEPQPPREVSYTPAFLPHTDFMLSTPTRDQLCSMQKNTFFSLSVTLKQISAGANPSHRALCCPEHPLSHGDPAGAPASSATAPVPHLEANNNWGRLVYDTASLKLSSSSDLSAVERKPEPVGTGGLWSPQPDCSSAVSMPYGISAHPGTG